MNPYHTMRLTPQVAANRKLHKAITTKEEIRAWSKGASVIEEQFFLLREVILNE